MNIRIAAAALPLLVALGTEGCDRRDAEPIEPADSATTVIEDDSLANPDIVTPTTPDPTATATTEADTENGGAVPIDTCAGLSGEAEAECLMRNNDGLPPTAEPVNPDEEAGEEPPATP